MSGFAWDFGDVAAFTCVSVDVGDMVGLQKSQKSVYFGLGVVRADGCDYCEYAFRGGEFPRRCMVDRGGLCDHANDVRGRHGD